ncbi:MAG: UDP-N-acetylmuramoyl-L-alanine--D-glutamate ligase [Actinobacteria bacterium]|nr:UDP-N-acetylmuramoyl-L-alanine--D-glutamate ligase [Actinomycetota bacterium]
MLPIRDAQVLIVGAGVTGTSVERVLTRMGAKVSLVDETHSRGDRLQLLPLADAATRHFDFVVVSPGWKITHPFLQELMSRKANLISEIDLAWQIKEKLLPSQKWIGITGTNGKTTAVELTTAILKEGGIRTTACGNVGDTVIEAVTSDQKFDYLVVELSSFQLEWSRLPSFSASAILNIADDHTDWHGGFDSYAQAKMRILDGTNLAILNGDDSVVVERSSNWDGRKVFYTLSAPKPGELGVVEDLLIDRAFVNDPLEAEVLAELHDVHPQAAHSVSNTLAASALGRSAGVAYSSIQNAVQNFRPGRHRIETILFKDGITWIDDSKATNPHAAAASIKSFSSVIWIAGGLAKGADMSSLVEKIAAKIKVAILIGADRELIGAALTKQFPNIPIIRVDGDKSDGLALMRRIVAQANESADIGDVVLLAPACASMDQFENYASRGDFFRDAVLELVDSK